AVPEPSRPPFEERHPRHVEERRRDHQEGDPQDEEREPPLRALHGGILRPARRGALDRSVGHVLFVQPEVVAELVDHRVADLADYLPAVLAVAEDGAAVDGHPVGEGQVVRVALRQRHPLVEAEELVLLGIEPEVLQIFEGGLLLDDDGDVFQQVGELLRQPVQGLLDESRELLRGHAHGRSLAAAGRRRQSRAPEARGRGGIISTPRFPRPDPALNDAMIPSPRAHRPTWPMAAVLLLAALHMLVFDRGLGGDGWASFAALESIVDDGDLWLENNQRGVMNGLVRSPSGHLVMQYPPGILILDLPPFLAGGAADAILPTRWHGNGAELPPAGRVPRRVFLSAAAIVLARNAATLLGLLWLALALRRLGFGEKISAAATALAFFGG